MNYCTFFFFHLRTALYLLCFPFSLQTALRQGVCVYTCFGVWHCMSCGIWNSFVSSIKPPLIFFLMCVLAWRPKGESKNAKAKKPFFVCRNNYIVKIDMNKDLFSHMNRWIHFSFLFYNLWQSRSFFLFFFLFLAYFREWHGGGEGSFLLLNVKWNTLSLTGKKKKNCLLLFFFLPCTHLTVTTRTCRREVFKHFSSEGGWGQVFSGGGGLGS